MPCVTRLVGQDAGSGCLTAEANPPHCTDGHYAGTECGQLRRAILEGAGETTRAADKWQTREGPFGSHSAADAKRCLRKVSQ